MDREKNKTFILTIKINFMSFITWEDNTKLNANQSRWLGFATILLLIVGALLPLITGHNIIYNKVGFNISIIALGIGTYLSAVKVGFPNTYETNDTWKTVVQVASAILNIIIPAAFVASSLTKF